MLFLLVKFIKDLDMGSKLHIDGNSGVVFIGDSTLDNASTLTDPLSVVDKLAFHSDLPYLQVIESETIVTTVTFPAVNANSVNTGGGGCC